MLEQVWLTNAHDAGCHNRLDPVHVYIHVDLMYMVVDADRLSSALQRTTERVKYTAGRELEYVRDKKMCVQVITQHTRTAC